MSPTSHINRSSPEPEPEDWEAGQPHTNQSKPVKNVGRTKMNQDETPVIPQKKFILHKNVHVHSWSFVIHIGNWDSPCFSDQTHVRNWLNPHVWYLSGHKSPCFISTGNWKGSIAPLVDRFQRNKKHRIGNIIEVIMGVVSSVFLCFQTKMSKTWNLSPKRSKADAKMNQNVGIMTQEVTYFVQNTRTFGGVLRIIPRIIAGESRIPRLIPMSHWAKPTDPSESPNPAVEAPT